MTSSRSEPHEDDVFDTSHLANQLGDRAVKGGAAAFLGQAAYFILQTSSTIILARLLTPADFGLIAMVIAVTGFIGRFKDMGFSMATVQREHVNNAQASNLFWINVVLSSSLTLVCVGLGPLLAYFYAEPSLTAITGAISLTYFFEGVSGQHLAIVRRQMRFTTLSLVEVTAYALGFAIALILAWTGAGYWALVALPVGQALARAVMLAAATKWVPRAPRRNTGVRSMIAYGANVSGFSLLTYLGRSADDVMIGRVWGASATGQYYKAYQLLTMPLEQINGPMNSVAVPVLSRLQNDRERYSQYYYRAVGLVAYLTGPLIALMGTTAHDLIYVALGSQWSRAASIFQILAFAAIFQPILYTAGWVWLSLDRTREMLRWSTLTAPAFVASFAVGLPWGPEGVAVAYAICVNALTPLGLRWSYRGTIISLTGTVAAVRRPYILSVLMVAVAYSTARAVPTMSQMSRLLVVISAALICGLVVALIVPSTRRDLLDLRTLVRRLRP